MSGENLNEVVPAVSPAEVPKVMQQHEITALVTGAKQKGYEKGQQEGYEKARSELSKNNPEQNQNFNNSLPTSTGIDESRLRQIASEEVLKQQQQLQAQLIQKQHEAAGQQILNDINAKSVGAKSKLQDYEKVVDPEFKNFAHVPEVLYYANLTDNPGEVLYDLAKNPSKIATIALLNRMGMSNDAASEVKKLSDSIKVNDMGDTKPKVKAPLSQITPSTVGVGNENEDSYANTFKGKY